MTIHAGVTVLVGAISAGVAVLGSVSYSSFYDGENSRQIKVNAERIHQLELNMKDIATTLRKIEIDTAVSREKAEWLYDNATNHKGRSSINLTYVGANNENYCFNYWPLC